MAWTAQVLKKLVSELPGVAVVVTDPDRLLETPEMQVALREAALLVQRWDGTTAMLQGILRQTADGHCQVLVVDGNSPQLHLVASHLGDHMQVELTVADVAKRLERTTVLGVPCARWNEVAELDRGLLQPLSARESSWLLARALYGVDVAYLQRGQWWQVLLWLVARDAELPQALARAVLAGARDAILRDVPESDALTALTERGKARALLVRKSADSNWLAGLTAPQRQQVAALTQAAATEQRQSARVSHAWPAAPAVPDRVLEHCHALVRADAEGLTDAATLAEADGEFGRWLVQNYNELVQRSSAKVLHVHSLLAQLVAEGAGPRDRLLLVVLDAVGLRTWHRVAPVWQQAGVFGQSVVRPALASLPTVTSVSRLAIFEGRAKTALWQRASGFATESHGWSQHPAVAVREDGRCKLFASDDEGREKLLGHLQRGVPRLAMVDTSWDKVIHHLDPQLQHVDEATVRWAEAAAPDWRKLVREAHANGYRVVVTADHGHVLATGAGLPEGRALTDSWSRRVMLFESPTARDAFATQGHAFQPATAPPGVFPLFSRPGEAFATRGQRLHCHGGLSMFEVLVPVAELKP